jgi:hypothetical protein
MSTAVDLSYLNDPFRESEASEGFAKRPDGQYRWKIDCVNPPEINNTTGRPFVKLEMIIISDKCGGQFKGQKQMKFWNLPTQTDEPDKVRTMCGMVKHDLKVLGVKIDDPRFDLNKFFQSHLGKLLDKVVDGRLTTRKNKKTNEDQQNVDFDKLVDAEEAAAAAQQGASTNGGADPEDGGAFDPFADE